MADAARIDALARELRAFDLAWYEIQSPQTLRTRRPPIKNGFGVVVHQPQVCMVCLDTGGSDVSAYLVEARHMLGVGGHGQVELCRDHARAYNDILVGDGSGLTVPEAILRASRDLTAAAKALVSDAYAPMHHVLYYEHDNSDVIHEGRAGHVVGLQGTAEQPSHEFALVQLASGLTNAIPVPQCGPDGMRQMAESLLPALPRGASYRGVGPDKALFDQVTRAMQTTMYAADADARTLGNRYSVVCLDPRTCRRSHQD